MTFGTMKRLLLCGIGAMCLSSWVIQAAETEAGASTSTSTASARSGQAPLLLRLSILSLHSQINPDYRSMKLSGDGGSSGGDDGGSDGGGGASASGSANSNFLALFAISPGPWRRGTLSLIDLQSLDSQDSRTVSGPFGKMVLPANLISAKYSYPLISALSADLRLSAMNIIHFSDPAVGLSWRQAAYSGWSKRLSISDSISTSDRSKSSNLLTRSSLRGSLEYSWSQLRVYGASGISKAFYSTEPSAPGPATQPQPTGTGRNNFSGGIPPDFRPDELDLILLTRERFRSSLASGVVWTQSESIRLSAGGRLALVKTLTGSSIWMSTVKPVGVIYTRKAWELGADLSFNSQITDYKNPPMPKLWNLGVSLSYSFGDSHSRI